MSGRVLWGKAQPRLERRCRWWRGHKQKWMFTEQLLCVHYLIFMAIPYVFYASLWKFRDDSNNIRYVVSYRDWQITAREQVQPSSCFRLTYESECLLPLNVSGKTCGNLFSPMLHKHLHNILDSACHLAKPKTCGLSLTGTVCCPLSRALLSNWLYALASQMHGNFRWNKHDFWAVVVLMCCALRKGKYNSYIKTMVSWALWLNSM